METMTIEMEKWIWMNAIKGNEVVYLPQKKKYYAMASGSLIPGDAIRVLTHDALIVRREETGRGDEGKAVVPVYEMTDQGLQYWEAVPGGIETLYGLCEKCQNVTDVKPVLLETLIRFCYMCVDCRSREGLADGAEIKS